MAPGRGLSLKIRIDLLFGLLLCLGLAADLGWLIADARPRVQTEDEAMMRISRDFAAAVLVGLKDSPDPEQGLRQALANIGRLRHVRIGLLRPGESPALALTPPEPRERAAPDWFARLIGARPTFAFLPAEIGGKPLGRIVIASDPADEIDEIWNAAESLALTGGAVVLAALVGASLLLGRTLRPLDAYGAALRRIGDGDFAARVRPAGSPEFVDIGEKINGLAHALENLSAANRELIRKLMDVQENERRALAHELHDEIGPHLFGLRANAAVLQAGLRQQGAEKQATLAGAICAQVEALQGQNKRILRRLWPAALDDLGLVEALTILVEGFRRSQPKVDIALSAAGPFEDCGPREKLALYRLVQEGLTNCLRHAEAGRVEIDLSAGASGEICARISDDGKGFDPAAPSGLGLTGMRERMRALGGRVSFGQGPLGGAGIEAVMPVEGR